MYADQCMQLNLASIPFIWIFCPTTVAQAQYIHFPGKPSRGLRDHPRGHEDGDFQSQDTPPGTDAAALSCTARQELPQL